jgi:hypothetical protein
VGIILAGILALGVLGCGGAAAARRPSREARRAVLSRYLREVEPVRLAVNRLLNGADPILSGYHDHRLTAAGASKLMGQLERRFAAYTVDVAAIRPSGGTLAALQGLYAHTYILEDSYLSALTVGLSERDLSDLPDTQDEQRAAIIQWRTGLTVLARELAFTLPGDLQVAGRGEIAPSPDGS